MDNRWTNCSPKPIYEILQGKEVVYDLPIFSILRRLHVVLAGDTGTIPFSYCSRPVTEWLSQWSQSLQHDHARPGSSRGAGDCCPMYFVNFWVLGWSSNLRCEVQWSVACDSRTFVITHYYTLYYYITLINTAYHYILYFCTVKTSLLHIITVLTSSTLAIIMCHYKIIITYYHDNIVINMIITSLLRYYYPLLHLLLSHIITKLLLRHYYIMITNHKSSNNDSIMMCHSKRRPPLLHHYFTFFLHY